MSDENDTQPLFAMAQMQLSDVFPVQLHARRFEVEEEPSEEAAAPIVRIGVTITVRSKTQIHVELRGEVLFESPTPPFEIEAAILGQFTIPPPSVEGQVPMDNIQRTATPILMPFLREAISELSARLRVPPVVLPLVTLVPPQPEQEVDASTKDSRGGYPPRRQAHNLRAKKDDI